MLALRKNTLFVHYTTNSLHQGVVITQLSVLMYIRPIDELLYVVEENFALLRATL